MDMVSCGTQNPSNIPICTGHFSLFGQDQLSNDCGFPPTSQAVVTSVAELSSGMRLSDWTSYFSYLHSNCKVLGCSFEIVNVDLSRLDRCMLVETWIEVKQNHDCHGTVSGCSPEFCNVWWHVGFWILFFISFCCITSSLDMDTVTLQFLVLKTCHSAWDARCFVVVVFVFSWICLMVSRC